MTKQDLAKPNAIVKDSDAVGHEHRFRTAGNHGFTLTELLVVIAIIAILASILFPVFARARENARRSSCLSNLKQLGLGVIQYNQDYDERMPLVTTKGCFPISQMVIRPVEAQNLSCETGSGYHYGWAEAIMPYLKSTQIFQCPSDAASKLLAGNLNLPYSSYGMNRYLGWMDGGGSPNDPQFESDCTSGYHDYCGDKPYALASVAAASEKVLMTEFGQSLETSLNVLQYRRIHYSIIPNRSPTYANFMSAEFMGNGTQFKVTPTHLATGNILFVDGHAKSITALGSSSEWIPLANAANSPAARHWFPDIP